MRSGHKTRLATLKRKIGAANRISTSQVSQVVIYNPLTGEPLNEPNPSAVRQIWIPDDGRGLQRPSR